MLCMCCWPVTQRAVEDGPVGSGIVVGMGTKEKLDLTSPELLFLHHSVLTKLQARKLYQRKANATASFRVVRGANRKSLHRKQRASALALSSSGSETAIEIELESESESDHEKEKLSQAQAAEAEETGDEDDDDDEAAALAQEEAERELARVARAKRLAAQRADPAARRAGFSPDAVVGSVEHHSRLLLPKSTHVSGHTTSEQHDQDSGARAKRGIAAPGGSGTHDAVAKRRRQVLQPVRSGEMATAEAAAPAAAAPGSGSNTPSGGCTANGPAAVVRDSEPVDTPSVQQSDSDGRHIRLSKAKAPACFKFQWDKPSTEAAVGGAQAAPLQVPGDEPHVHTEILPEWSLLYQEDTPVTASQSQQKRKRQPVAAADADERAREPVAPGERSRGEVAVEAADSDGAAAAPIAADENGDSDHNADGRSEGELRMADDFTTGIDLLTALAAGKQRERSESSNDDSGSADVNERRSHGPVSDPVARAPDRDSDTSRDRSAAAPPIGSSTKARAEAQPRVRRPASGNKRARSVLSPWDSLLHNLLQQAHHNDEPSYRTVMTLEAPAAHALQMLAESFLRRRWEQAIAAATHVRNHEFSS